MKVPTGLALFSLCGALSIQISLHTSALAADGPTTAKPSGAKSSQTNSSGAKSSQTNSSGAKPTGAKPSGAKSSDAPSSSAKSSKAYSTSSTATATLKFHPKLISTANYVYNNNGEDLHHTVKTYRSTSGSFRMDSEIIDDLGLISIKLFSQGKQIFSRSLPRWKGLSEDSFKIIDPATNSDCSAAPVFRDINDDGVPEMILINDSGSAHGKVELTIFRVTPGTDPLKEMCKADLQSPNFVASSSPAIYAINDTDQAFAYWKDSAYCDFAPPHVVLNIKGTRLVADADLMRKAPPGEAEYGKIVQAVEKTLVSTSSQDGQKLRSVTPSVWNAMNKLVYSGNADVAKKLLERLYPDDTRLVVTGNGTADPKEIKQMPKVTRAQFWNDYCTQLQTSAYVKAIQAMDAHKVLQ